LQRSHQPQNADNVAVLFQRALKEDPSYALAQAGFFAGHHAESVGMFKEATELAPQSYMCWGNLADAYRWTPGEKDRAKATYPRAIGLAERPLEVNPRDTDALAYHALYQAKSGGAREGTSVKSARHWPLRRRM